MNKHLKILTDSSIIIKRIQFLLEENNIPTLVKNNVESARLAGFGTSQDNVELYIYSSDFENAQKIIEEFRKENTL